MSSRAEPRPGPLAAALLALGAPARVEVVGTLAVLTPAPGAPPDWPALRHEIVRLATLHGFSHVALELPAAAGQGGA